jgi:hypothetical protein
MSFVEGQCQTFSLVLELAHDRLGRIGGRGEAVDR